MGDFFTKNLWEEEVSSGYVQYISNRFLLTESSQVDSVVFLMIIKQITSALVIH